MNIRRKVFSSISETEERAFSEGYRLGRKMFAENNQAPYLTDPDRHINPDRERYTKKILGMFSPEGREKVSQRAQRDSELLTNSLREEARREVMTGRQSTKAKELIDSCGSELYEQVLDSQRDLMHRQLELRKRATAMKEAAKLRDVAMEERAAKIKATIAKAKAMFKK